MSIDPQTILDSLGDGVYVTDCDRRILYWNKAAERITGWTAEEVIGLSCFDNILCHVNKDGHRLCGKEYCPLHRSIVTGGGSECPLMYAKAKDGRRIPMQTTVSPLRSSSGEVIGGVEVFRDLGPAFRDLARAKSLQTLSMQHDLPTDARVQFRSHYVPHDVVGGDFYGIRQLNDDQYGFFLADVMGHGLAAALYTMHLSALWDRYHPLLKKNPSVFAVAISNELNRIVQGGESFAAGVCGVVDLERREIRFSGAGNPPALRIHPNGEFDEVPCSGLPLGIMKDAPYDNTQMSVSPGDRVLFFTDGAVEVHDIADHQLGVDGLIGVLKNLGYPHTDIQVSDIEVKLLKYSNSLRIEDDLTIAEIRFM